MYENSSRTQTVGVHTSGYYFEEHFSVSNARTNVI